MSAITFHSTGHPLGSHAFPRHGPTQAVISTPPFRRTLHIPISNLSSSLPFSYSTRCFQAHDPVLKLGVMAGADSASLYHPTSKPSKSSTCRKTNVYTLVVILCVISYLLGSYQKEGALLSTAKTTTSNVLNVACAKTSTVGNHRLDFSSHHNATGLAAEATEVKNYPRCGVEYSEYTPCEDHARSLRYKRTRMMYRERHCPKREEGEILKCRIPAPAGYRNPFPWPKSRDLAWFANVPHRELTVEKAVQNWIRFEGDRFRFPGGGTMFPKGADAYIDNIGKLINLRDGSIRTAIDTGCGVTLPLPFFLLYRLIFTSFSMRAAHFTRDFFFGSLL